MSLVYCYLCNNCNRVSFEDDLCSKCAKIKKQGAVDMLIELDKVDKRLLGTADYLKNKIKVYSEGVQ